MKDTAKTLTELFRKNLNKEKLEVKVENLKNESVAAMMTLSEESRRMQDMMKMYNMYGMDPGHVWRSGNFGAECESSAGKISCRKYRSLNMQPVICQQLI